MAKFRKKPVVIDAVRVGKLGIVEDDMEEWVALATATGVLYRGEDGDIHVKTLEGDMRVGPGDWIIMGVKGELYPIKNDIFVQTYEGNDKKRRTR